MSGREIAVAIIGAGFIADYHVNGLRAAGGARVAAIVGRDADRTAARARQLGIPAASTDVATVLADPAIDAVVIATPDDTHEALAIEALAAGKAVLLQKPMAMTSAACRNVLAARDRSSAPLTVSFMHRHFPEVRWLRDRLADGALGVVRSVRIRNATPGADWSDWFYAPDRVAGGVVMQLGVHGIDLLQHLLGPIRAVSAEVATARPVRTLSDGRTVETTLEDTAAALYRFAGGTVASHEMDYAEAGGTDRFRLELHAEHASVWLRSERGPAAIVRAGGGGWETPHLAAEPPGAHHHRHWLAIVRGEAPPDDTPEAGLASVLVAETVYRSARERRSLAIAPAAAP